jgi:hypothetical protein
MILLSTKVLGSLWYVWAREALADKIVGVGELQKVSRLLHCAMMP